MFGNWNISASLFSLAGQINLFETQIIWDHFILLTFWQICNVNSFYYCSETLDTTYLSARKCPVNWQTQFFQWKCCLFTSNPRRLVIPYELHEKTPNRCEQDSSRWLPGWFIFKLPLLLLSFFCCWSVVVVIVDVIMVNIVFKKKEMKWK